MVYIDTFVNENFDKLITFPKGSTQYRLVFSTVFCKYLMSQLFGEQILEFGLFKFFSWPHLLAEAACTYFVSW